MPNNATRSISRRSALALLLIGTTNRATAERLYRLGTLGVEPFDPADSAMVVELARRGYGVGRNLEFVIKNAGSDAGLLDVLAAELVADKVDLIVSMSGNSSARAAKRATTTIPIVMLGSGDPVEDGLVESLARPGGNVTGNVEAGEELSVKRMQLLMEVLPPRTGVGVLVYEPLAARPRTRRTVDALEALARAGNRALVIATVRKVERGDDLDRPLQLLKDRGVAGVLLSSWSTIGASAERVGILLVQKRLAGIMEWGGFAEAGVLMTYAEASNEPERRVAAFIDRIFRGARPADLPTESGTRFELAINLKTAALLGLSVPPSLLLRAETLIR